MNPSLRTVIILNFLIILIGLTPVYTAFSGGFRRVSGPLEAGLSRLNVSFISGVTFVLSLPKIYSQNLSLKDELVHFREIESKYSATLDENEILKAQLKLMPGVKSPQLIMARVLGQNITDSSLTLDVGAESGVKEGDSVTYKGLLLGKIIQTDANRSRLLLTVSPQSRFEAVTSNFSARGEVVGDFGNRLNFTKILPSQTVNVGDTVLDFGSRLILGKVEKVQAEGAQIFKAADVSVLYDPGFLTEVFILAD